MPKNAQRAKQMRQIFRTMDAHQAQAIREAYYKACDGLLELAAELAIAANCSEGILSDELRIALDAKAALDTSDLGAAL